MVNQALEVQEQEFTASRSSDSDEDLLEYLRFCASVMGHSPWPREIVGGLLIQQRFGTWENALVAAHLSLPTAPDRISGFVRYQAEVLRQQEIYRQKKAAKKLRAQKRMQG